MANKELGNTAVYIEEYAWKGLDIFDRNIMHLGGDGKPLHTTALF